jgi:hypothetical protein
VQKRDPADGALLWQTDETAYSINHFAVTSSGYVYVTMFRSSSRSRLSKYDTAGDIMWSVDDIVDDDEDSLGTVIAVGGGAE